MRRGSWQSAYLKLYAAFLMTGLMHAAGDIAHPLGVPGMSLRPFIAQPFIITLEDRLLVLAQRARMSPPRVVARVIGYAWTFGWLVFSLHGYLSYVMRLGAQPLPPTPAVVMLAKYLGLH